MMPEKYLVLLRSTVPYDPVGGRCAFYPMTMAICNFGQLVEIVKMVRAATERSTSVNRQTRSAKIDVPMPISRRCNSTEQMKMRASTRHTNDYVRYVTK